MDEMKKGDKLGFSAMRSADPDSWLTPGEAGGVESDPFKTKPLPPLPESRLEPRANSPWHSLVVLFRWLGEFVRDRLSPLLLGITTLGICGFLVGIGFGLGRWAGLALLVGSLAATCWVIMSLSGVWPDEK
jgi:hypothetical protein